MAFVTQNPYATPLFLNPRPERVAKRELTKEEQDEVTFAFGTLDTEKKGFVTQKQLKVALRAMGFPVKKADIQELLRRFGEEDTQQLTYELFRTAIAEKLCERTPEDDMRRAFKLFDVLGVGKIDVMTLRKIIKSLGLEISDNEVQDMISEFDQDRDGLISEAEFMAIMTAGADM
eukprot:CAMPEP_0202894756 /NCGR_PEP_ID=MMETSP1392-20130828/4085_1 /ASSEMBLY_ACC=CAM_ASM_000868 /TAXON_ID=225041 /ORGANISM="Chlamydomonas chlamydogama, Strain SAG 11-48b" /LENGTH=174 /DNA_ID=CAMNT_0049579537 /DNA_START=12 /DNA_END=536 /DNA_ORIENTATION=-